MKRMSDNRMDEIEEHREEWGLDAKLADEIWDALKAEREIVERARQDINWMLNERKFLNPFVFDYLD